MSEDIQATVLFGVPLYRKRFGVFFDRQRQIADELLALRERDAGVVLSNERGWHSSGDLRGCDSEPVRWLMARLGEAAATCINAFEHARPHGAIRMISSWANINQNGAWNMPHIHIPAQWSGVFYVQVGEPAPPKGEHPAAADGNILFFDPLPLGERFRRPTTVGIPPEDGVMLLFPSYVNHMVAPYYAASPRISIAFNLVIDPPAGAPRAGQGATGPPPRPQG